MNAYAHWLLRHRIWAIVSTLLATAVLAGFASGLKVVIDPAALAPQGHPYIQATNRLESVFGSKYLMLVGVTPEQGDVFQPAVLQAVQRITRKLAQSPGVVKTTLLSLAAPQAKAITGHADGFEARQLLEPLPATPVQVEALKTALRANPVYLDTIVSRDFKTAAILVELHERSDGFEKMVEPVRAIVEEERAEGLRFTFGGNPAYLELTEQFSRRIDWLFPVALVVIGLLHFEAFRTWQGLILPLVTALMSVVWGMGAMGILKLPLDIFNSPTPILILAVAAGHAVQLLKRYYEEYDRLASSGAHGPAAANRLAVVSSLARVGPVMIVAGGVAALGFFSLMAFDIATIRTFGLFTGIGILSAVLLEVTFIPAVRSLLKPPAAGRSTGTTRRTRAWDGIPAWIAAQAVSPRRRLRLVGALLLSCVLAALGALQVVVDNASKRFFSESLSVQGDDTFLNQRLGGTQSLYVMVEGRGADSIKSPDLLAGIEQLQRYAQAQPHVGKTLSIVDYLKRMNLALNGDEPQADRLPSSRELISQYLLLYSLSGSPGDFDGVVDHGYRAAKITILLKTGSNAYIKALVDRLEAKARDLFGPHATVTFGGDVTQTIALTDTMVRGKLLNILQISAAVFIVSALAFRSFVAGLLVLLPLAVAVLAVFGAMGALGIPLNIPNSLISAMAVGIGADYAIYLLHRLREEVRAGNGAEAAVTRTLATAGQAVLFVATAVALGYGTLALSWGYKVHQWLALFISLAMAVSALASLTLLPSLVLWWRPRFIFGPASPPPGAAAKALLGIGGAAALSGLLSMAPGPARAQPGPDAAEVMGRSYAATRVRDSASDATFTLTHRDGATRVRKTHGLTLLRPGGRDNMRLVRFLAPADIAGTATLMVENAAGEDDLWVYLPALGKVRRLSASNKKDAFVGTDFSYGDVIGHRPQDWDHAWLRDEEVDGAPCHVIESRPRGDAVRDQGGYSRRLSWVRKDNFVLVRGEFWDLGGAPLKRFSAGDVRPVAPGRWQAMRSTVENLQTGHRTTLLLENFKAEQGVPEASFRPQALER